MPLLLLPSWNTVRHTYFPVRICFVGFLAFFVVLFLTAQTVSSSVGRSTVNPVVLLSVSGEQNIQCVKSFKECKEMPNMHLHHSSNSILVQDKM